MRRMPLDAVGIIASNLEMSLEFYRHFGLEFAAIGGNEHFEVTTNSGMRLMLDSESLIRKINPNWQKQPGSNVVLCFRQETPDKVDELFARITAAKFDGVKKPFDAFWGQRYASVKDPDGNQIDIFC